MAEDAYAFAEKLPESRLKRKLRRLERLSEGHLPKARPGERGGIVGVHKRRKKKGEYAP